MTILYKLIPKSPSSILITILIFLLLGTFLLTLFFLNKSKMFEDKFEQKNQIVNYLEKENKQSYLINFENKKAFEYALKRDSVLLNELKKFKMKHIKEVY